MHSPHYCVLKLLFFSNFSRRGLHAQLESQHPCIKRKRNLSASGKKKNLAHMKSADITLKIMFKFWPSVSLLYLVAVGLILFKTTYCLRILEEKVLYLFFTTYPSCKNTLKLLVKLNCQLLSIIICTDEHFVSRLSLTPDSFRPSFLVM